MLPRAGAINGIQYMMMHKSGCAFKMYCPVFHQLNGFTEFISGVISKPFGASPSVNCVFPGKKNAGYCRVYDTISTKCPFWESEEASASEKFAIPPLKGKAGAAIITFTIYK